MANVTFRMDDTLKSDMQSLVRQLGMDMSTAFSIFAAQAVREQRIPFEITMERPNKATLRAFKEADEIKKHPSSSKGYTNVDDLFEDILNEV